MSTDNGVDRVLVRLGDLRNGHDGTAAPDGVSSRNGKFTMPTTVAGPDRLLRRSRWHLAADFAVPAERARTALAQAGSQLTAFSSIGAL